MAPLPEQEQLARGGAYWLAYTRAKKFGAIKKAFCADDSWRPLLELFKHAVGYSERTIYAILLSINDERARNDPEKLEAAFQEFEEYKKRIHELLGDDGVMILPSSLSVAPFHHGVSSLGSRSRSLELLFEIVA